MEYMDKLYSSVKHRLTSIESKLLMADQYNFIYGTVDKDERAETLFSVTMARDSESVYEYTEHEVFVTEYIAFRYNDILGMSLKEFLSLTRYEKDNLKEILKKELEKRDQINKVSEKEMNNAARFMGEQ